MEFKTTHIIEHNARRIPVCVVDGAAYTRAEWDSDSPADWELSDEGVLLFQGQPPHGSWSVAPFDSDAGA